MTGYRKDFDETKFISFLIKDDELLEKYDWNLGEKKRILKKKFDCEPVFNKKYLKATNKIL